jgi:hypothetical protein
MDEMFFHESRQPVISINDEIMHCRVETKPKKKKINSKRNVVACGVAIVLTTFLVGIGLGFWICNLQKAFDSNGNDPEEEETQSVVRHEDITAQIDRREIEKYLRFANYIDFIYTPTRGRTLSPPQRLT